MNYLDYPEEKLKALGAYWTAKEIQQQPGSWQKTVGMIERNAPALEEFLSPVLANLNSRIILTGAGSSAFAGGCIAPDLSLTLDRRVEAIATTDLVANPRQFLQGHTPTLIVSFARSGDSPESVAAVELAEDLIADCRQLVLTCNPQGKLYERCKGSEHGFALLMPEETNDRSFAMTSSFSSMMLSALAIFSGIENLSAKFRGIGATSQNLIETQSIVFKDIAENNFGRVVFLGSGGMKSLAREAALKLLELTDGQTIAVDNSPLGFRHGPITIVNDDTLVVIFMSNNTYTRKYDLDLLRELRNDGDAGQVIAISAQDDEISDGDYILIENLEETTDSMLMFPFVVCAQLYAFHHALKLNNTPDTPSSSGTATRVVQGVSIHSFAAE